MIPEYERQTCSRNIQTGPLHGLSADISPSYPARQTWNPVNNIVTD